MNHNHDTYLTWSTKITSLAISPFNTKLILMFYNTYIAEFLKMNPTWILKVIVNSQPIKILLQAFFVQKGMRRIGDVYFPFHWSRKRGLCLNYLPNCFHIHFDLHSKAWLNRSKFLTHNPSLSLRRHTISHPTQHFFPSTLHAPISFTILNGAL